MKVTGQDRTAWPVLEVDRRILWMRGVELEPDPAIRIAVEPIPSQPAEETAHVSPSSADLSR
jgi:hypothetical protein